MKLSDIILRHGSKLTKTGKQRLKGGKVWAKEFEKYLMDEFQWDHKTDPYTLEAPNSTLIAEQSYNGITFYCSKSNWEVTVSQPYADEVEIDKQNRLIIVDNNLAIKI